MASPYRLRHVTPDEASALTRVATDAFNAAGNKVDTQLFPPHLRSADYAQEAFAWRVSALRPTLDRAKFPDRWTVAVVMSVGSDNVDDEEEEEEEIAGWAQWQAPVVSDGSDSSKTRSIEENITEAEARTGGFPPSLDPVAMRVFLDTATAMKKQSLGDEGDKDMWSEFFLWCRRLEKASQKRETEKLTFHTLSRASSPDACRKPEAPAARDRVDSGAMGCGQGQRRGQGRLRARYGSWEEALRESWLRGSGARAGDPR